HGSVPLTSWTVNDATSSASSPSSHSQGSRALESLPRPAVSAALKAYSPRLPGVGGTPRPPRRHVPLGGVERPRRKVRFARLIHRRGRVLGGPSAQGGMARAAKGRPPHARPV